ncbi:MAG: hypothetical protein L0Y80_08190 [Ignavibacteriae bacterium]|nr:hypothetical protein [Ignavibacteriota bacterium]
MRTIESVIGRDLQWVQPSIFKQVFELRNSSTVIAKLTLPRLFSEEARAESADGCWKFTRKGIWKTTISVFECEDEQPIVSFEGKRWGKKFEIQLPGGEKLLLATDLWGWKFSLQTETGEMLAEVKRKGFFSGTYNVDLRRRGSSYKELPWLVMLVWYIMILERRRQHAAAG